MNLEEYRNRIEKAHTITGIPSYWDELRKMTEDRDRWRNVADIAVQALREGVEGEVFELYDLALQGKDLSDD